MSKSIKYIILILFLIISFNCFSQIAMQIDLSRKSFIQYENIFVTLHIRNITSHPLVFGENKQLSGKLVFLIRDEHGELIKSRKEANEDFLYGTILNPGKTAELTLSLSQVYAINKPGSYSVKALISHTQLANSFLSNEETFKVVPGSVVWKAEVGVPAIDSMGKNEKIQKRTYEIKSYYDGENKVYCLVVSDKNYVYGIVRIGIDLGAKKPSCMIDNYSRIHILAENRNKEYEYFVYDVNCNLDEKEQYSSQKSMPSLEVDDKTGDVEVVGGSLVIENES